MLWEISNEQLIVSFALICCISFVGGWLADNILGYAGFSVIGNWILLLLGAYVGLISYNLLGYRFYINSHITYIIMAGSALGLLFLMMAIKAIFKP